MPLAPVPFNDLWCSGRQAIAQTLDGVTAPRHYLYLFIPPYAATGLSEFNSSTRGRRDSGINTSSIFLLAQNRNVPFGSRGDISAFGEGRRKTFAPGMIGSRFGGAMRFGFESEVKLFGRDDLSLLGLLVVNGVRQGFAIIQDGHLFLGVETNRDLRIAQGIRGAVGLNLVDGLLKLDGQVFGKGAGFLPGQNASEIVFGSEGAMGIDGTSRFFAKALVEIRDELWQIGIALCQAGNATQTHFFGQAILQGLNDPFHASFGLWGVGTDDLDVQFLHRSSKLGQGIAGASGGHIDPKNAVFIAVEGHRLATAPEIALRRPGSN